MSIYKWKSGYFGGGDAQAIGEQCAELERTVGLTPKSLVEASRPEDAPAHGQFEWDDEVAAEKYRETQAGYIIRHLEAVPSGDWRPVRAFLSATPSDGIVAGKKAYVSVEAAMANEGLREQVLRSAWLEMEAFSRKYKDLEEVSAVLSAMDEALALMKTA